MMKMNDIKEKIIKILDDFPYDLKDYVGNNEVFMVDNHVELADHLIVNGVTVQKHGQWIISKEKDTFGYINHYHCSQCGRESKDVGNYCSNCGAIMDGGFNVKR